MKICFLFILVLSVSSIASQSQAAVPVDTLRFEPTKQSVVVVVTNMLNRLGADSLRKVYDRTETGMITYHSVDSTVSGKIVMVSQSPNMKHDLVDINGRTIEHFVDGTHAWLKPDTLPAREITGKSLSADLADAVFNPELHLFDTGTSIMLLGTGRPDSIHTAYVLKIESKNAPAELWYVDADSWLIVQRSKQLGSRLLTIRYSDFKSVAGVTYPFSYDVGGLENYSIHFDSIKINTHPNSRQFTLSKK